MGAGRGGQGGITYGGECRGIQATTAISTAEETVCVCVCLCMCMRVCVRVWCVCVCAFL